MTESDLQFFEEKIRPVLVNECYECHSAKSEKIKGGLLLDTRVGLLQGGDSGPALVPGDAAKSRLMLALHHSEEIQMPPKKKLPAEQIADFERWIEMGAPDPREAGVQPGREAIDLWSAKAIRKVEPPKVGKSEWVRDPVDAFILSRLEEARLTPVGPADKRTLIRRATFDLIGLPPVPAEIVAFLNDDSPEAFAKVVDRLLASPHFGERWGRHWLDVARYADSNGLDANNTYDNAWRYRDYVIQAFNEDKPFDQFIREQLAGDLLPAPDQATLHQNWIATGFLLLGPKNFLEPNRDKLLMDIADEQIDVTSRAFLGLTVSCARCHDHKFDPIPTRDYYAMAGIFRSTVTVTGDRTQGIGGTPWSERPLGTPEEAKAVEAYNEQLSKVQAELAAARQMRATLPGGIDSTQLDGIVMDNEAAEVIGSWKLSNYSTNFVDKNYLHDGNEKAGKGKKLVRFRPAIPEEGLYEIRLAYTARPNRATNAPIRVVSETERTVYLNQTVEPIHNKAFETLGVFELSEGTNNLVEVLTEGTKGFVVVDAVQFLPKDVELASRLKKMPLAGNTAPMMMNPAMQQDELEYKFMEMKASAPPPLPMAMAVREGEVQNCKINLRGDPAKLGEEVPRGFLTVIPIKKEMLPESDSGRLELAEWIADPDNPLTARVRVNRIWLHLFGHGIVETPDNFGLMGQPPSHPELLDHLASDFIDEGWSTKKLIRRIMLSQTYQMSSDHHQENAATDPENKLLWRMNRKRLEPEALRDTMLLLSGALDKTIGGDVDSESPVTNPPVQQNGLDSNRRSVYLRILRNNVPDFLQVLDFPDPHVLAGKRHTTSAPTQALLFMNSPFLIGQAFQWSTNLLADGGKTDAQLVELAYLSSFARPPSSKEKDTALRFILKFNSSLAGAEPDATRRKQKTFETFCHALYQSTEFRFVN